MDSPYSPRLLPSPSAPTNFVEYTSKYDTGIKIKSDETLKYLTIKEEKLQKKGQHEQQQQPQQQPLAQQPPNNTTTATQQPVLVAKHNTINTIIEKGSVEIPLSALIAAVVLVIALLWFWR